MESPPSDEAATQEAIKQEVKTVVLLAEAKEFLGDESNQGRAPEPESEPKQAESGSIWIVPGETESSQPKPVEEEIGKVEITGVESAPDPRPVEVKLVVNLCDEKDSDDQVRYDL